MLVIGFIMRKKKADWTWLKVGLVILVVVVIVQNNRFQKSMPAVVPNPAVLNNTVLVMPTTSQGVNVVPGSGGSSYVRELYTRIMNFHVCKDEAHSLETCDFSSELHDDNTIFLYWEVQNGVGCCSTFGCDEAAFRSACLDPVRLFDVYVDNVLLPWDNSPYDYTCDARTPWNFYEIDGLSIGEHDIEIKQKDCIAVISEATLKITLSREGPYVRVLQVRIK